MNETIARRMRIICDPYKKEIKYQWFVPDIKKYVDFDPVSSKLASSEFTKTSFQNRAYQIVKEIIDECNFDNVGLEIVFIGTQSDYEILCLIIETFFQQGYKIKCTKDVCYYNMASDVLPKIKEKFDQIKDTLDEYTVSDKNNEIKKAINKYSDAVKQSVSLCFLGLVSVGKSSFINSIIGMEILPSDTNPTTAKIFKIAHCKDKYEIKFKIDDKECVLSFEGKDYKPSGNFDAEIIEKLQSILKSVMRHDEIHHMNKALKFINDYKNDSHVIGDLIEIRVPFQKAGLPVDEFEFLIYDTPGSNPAKDKKHFDILKEYLNAQTNNLPILVTTLPLMGVKGNEDILKLIEKQGMALDTTHAIVVVNRADEEPDSELEDKSKNKNTFVFNWKSTEVFFASSAIGIASKKNNPDDPGEWIDEKGKMKWLYEKNKKDFAKDERKLFKYNIIDRSKVDELENIYKDEDLTTHLYKNSGLESIEKEIGDYARKYATYNKCLQGSTYLQDAIKVCNDNINVAENELTLMHIQTQLEKKELQLWHELNNKRENDIRDYNAQFVNLMQGTQKSYLNSRPMGDDHDKQKELRVWIQNKWNEAKKEAKGDNNQAMAKIQKQVADLYNRYLEEYCGIANGEIVPFWDLKSEEFKKDCIKIVSDSDAFTEKQKDVLKELVLSASKIHMDEVRFNLEELGVIQKRIILWWKGKKFNINSCKNVFIDQFKKDIYEKNVKTQQENSKKIEEWTKNLIALVEDKLSEFNSDVKGYVEKINELEKEIKSQKECKEMLSKNQIEIKKLLDVQGGEICE